MSGGHEKTMIICVHSFIYLIKCIGNFDTVYLFMNLCIYLINVILQACPRYSTANYDSVSLPAEINRPRGT